MHIMCVSERSYYHVPEDEIIKNASYFGIPNTHFDPAKGGEIYTAHFDEAVYTRFRHACLEDIKIAREVTMEAKRRKKLGKPVRLKFTSFKHLIIDLHEDDNDEAALRVMERAAALGLKGYAEKALKLRNKLGL